MATPGSRRIRSRLEKVASLVRHGGRAYRLRHHLERLADRSPVARALVALSQDQFTDAERQVLAAIEHQRARLFGRRDAIEWRIEDPIDPVTALGPMHQIVGPGARLSSVKRRWGLLLYVLVREVAPKTCVELGACFGLSGLYIQAALRQVGGGRFITFEGSRARAGIARTLYQSMGFADATVVVGDFDRTAAPALAELGHVGLAFIDGNHRLAPTLRYDALMREHGSAGTVIVHDDIRWSAEMTEAWRRVRARGGGRTFDAFRVGIVELDAAGTQGPATLDAWLGWSHLRHAAGLD